MNVLESPPADFAEPPRPANPSDDPAVTTAFAQLFNLFLPPTPIGDAASLNGAPLIESDGKSLETGELPVGPTRSASLRGSVDFESLVADLNVTSAPINQNVPGPENLPGDGATSSLAPDGTETAAIEPRPQRHKVLATEQAAPVSLPANSQMIGSFEYRDTSRLNITGLESAAPASHVRMERALANPAAAIAPTPSDDKLESDFPMAISTTDAPAGAMTLPETIDAPTPKPPVEAPAVPKTSQPKSGDPDELKAAPLTREDRPATAVNLTSITAQASDAQKPTAGARRWPATERRLEIESDSHPATPRQAFATEVTADTVHGHGDGLAPAQGSAQDGTDESWQGDSRANREFVAPSNLAGAAAPSEGGHDHDVTAPAWRPMVDRLARDIADHLRVGKQEAVLQLDPPELGRVKIDLRIEDGQLHVRIATDGHESQGLIESHLPELQQALRAGQLNVGDLRVTQGEWNSGGALMQDFNNQTAQGRQQAPRGFAGSGSRGEAGAEPPAQARRSAEGRVSMWA